MDVCIVCFSDEKIGKLWVFCFYRFDESDISPLTVKALSVAGYFQMTRVQEATLSVCREGVYYCLFGHCVILSSFLWNLF